jgi:hypothetical protein
MDRFDRMMWAEEQRAAAAETKASIEADFAAREAHIDAAAESRRVCGPYREREIKQKSAPRVVHKVTINSSPVIKRKRRALRNDAADNSWADSFTKVIAAEIAKTESELDLRLHQKIEALRAEISELRTRLSVVESVTRGEVKMLPSPKGRDDAA